jgi:SET domain-containing protein
MIYLARTKRKGKGVFAEQGFSKGDVIERAPVIVIPAEEWKYIEKTVLYHYVYSWGEDGEEMAMALGLGSCYNHSYTPNAEFDTLLDEEVIEFVAARDIAAGEEITINYNGPGDDSPLWFKVHR